MDKKNNNVIASIHADFTGDMRDTEQGMAISIEGNPLTLGIVYLELTKALLNAGVPRDFLETGYKGGVEKACKGKSEEDHIKDMLSALTKIFN